MWHSCPSRPRSGREAGFTLIEATISLALLLIVLIMSMAFLISMRTFSQRQEAFAAPRQTSRRAMDYLSYYVRGASDMNSSFSFPTSVLTWYNDGATDKQCSYNNVTTVTYADAGTDIINLATPTNTIAFNATTYPGNTGTATWNTFTICGVTGATSATTLALFKTLTGAHANSSGQIIGGVNPVVQGSTAWGFYQLTDYQDTTNASCCPSNGIQVTSAAAKQDGVWPAGGQPTLSGTVTLLPATYVAFRVKGGQLQQRFGAPFQPSAPDVGFVNLLSNVEDLQIAYIMADGNIYNQSATTLDPDTNNIPSAANAANVRGLRVSVTGVSSSLSATNILTKNVLFRPASEDHTAGATDRSYHYRLTSTILIRNRALGY